MNFLDLIWLIPLFPAIGFVINGLIGKRVSKTMVGVIAAGAVLLSFIFSAGAVWQLLQLEPEQRSHTVTLYHWIDAGAVRTAEGPLARPVEPVRPWLHPHLPRRGRHPYFRSFLCVHARRIKRLRFVFRLHQISRNGTNRIRRPEKQVDQDQQRQGRNEGRG